MTTVGLLHPGAMGVTVGATCDAEVLWVSGGRSGATVERARRAGLREVEELTELVERSQVIVSVCPPEAAVDLADEVAALRFDGVYVDANAVSPATARRIGARFDRFVDAGIVGPPAVRAGTTRLYLSGDDAADVAGLWAGSPLDVRVIEGGDGAASALKMAYATWTKVSAALLLDVRALARAEGVEQELLAEWAISQPGSAERSEATAAGVAGKAWRFSHEMREIAATFEAAGLPGGFGTAAAELYDRLAGLRDVEGADLDRVLRELLS